MLDALSVSCFEIVHEFGLRVISYEREKPIDVSCKGSVVGKYRLDIRIENLDLLLTIGLFFFFFLWAP